jgi:hypothetical protein
VFLERLDAGSFRNQPNAGAQGRHEGGKMNAPRISRPSPALIVATAALFVALGGTAGAVVNAAVPLAKRALVADNAKKLGGMTSAQIATQAAKTPGPASSAAGLVSVKTGSWSLGPNGESDFTIACDAGQKAIGGGWDDPGGFGHGWDDRPMSDGSAWRVYMTMADNAPGTQSGGLYAVCLR